MVAEAREEARRVRARAAEQVLRTAGSRAAALLAEADRETAAVQDRARDRMPGLVDRAVALVLEDLATERTAPASAESPRTSGREGHEEGTP